MPLDPADRRTLISIHALLAESDVPADGHSGQQGQFLSTLSLRRATGAGWQHPGQRTISIHALLAESDAMTVLERLQELISIHALLAESDGRPQCAGRQDGNFYPRSPCGERRRPDQHRDALPKFLSTLSLRRATSSSVLKLSPPYIFLSTLSLRRATHAAEQVEGMTMISIHALLAESDCRRPRLTACCKRFLSTLSLRRATHPRPPDGRPYKNFYPRSPCGERLPR